MSYRYTFTGSIQVHCKTTQQLESLKQHCADVTCLNINEKGEITGIDGSKDGWKLEDCLKNLVGCAIDLGYSPDGAIGMSGDREEDVTVFYIALEFSGYGAFQTMKRQFRIVTHQDAKQFTYTLNELEQKKEQEWEEDQKCWDAAYPDEYIPSIIEIEVSND